MIEKVQAKTLFWSAPGTFFLGGTESLPKHEKSFNRESRPVAQNFFLRLQVMHSNSRVGSGFSSVSELESMTRI